MKTHSLKWRFVFATTTWVLALSAVSAWYFPREQQKRLLEEQGSELSILTESAALSVGLGLSNNEYDAIDRVESWLRRYRDLEYAAFYDDGGNLFAVYPDSVAVPEKMPSIGRLHVSSRSLIYCTPVDVSGQLFGYLAISHSMAPLHAKTRASQRDALLFGLLASLIGILLASVVAETAVGPIRRLRDATRRIAAGDYTRAVRIDDNTELGDLAADFNSMVHDIAESSNALKRANDKLAAEIQQRQITENNLREREQQLRLTQFAVDRAADAVFRITPCGEFSYVNGKACELLGYTREELLNLTIHDVATDIPVNACSALWSKVRDRGSFIMERVFRTKNGDTFPVEMTANYLNYEGDELCYASVRDITERKQAEERIFRSEARARAVIDNSRDAIIGIDHQGNVSVFNPAAETMFGVSAVEIAGQSLARIIPAEYRDRHNKGLDHMLETGTSCGVIGTTVELEGLRADGTVFPIEMTLASCDGAGELSATAVIRDITERKQAEQIRHRLATAIEQAGEGILITNLNGVVLYVNPAYEKVSGYTGAEVIGNRPPLFEQEADPDASSHDMWETIRSGQVWSGRISSRKKDGTAYQADITVSPVRDSRHEIVNFVAVERDVTEQITLESELQQAQKLRSVGALAAGIAHEINTPIQFVGDNVRFMSDSFKSLTELLRQAVGLVETLTEHPDLKDRLEEFTHVKDEADVDFLCEEIPRAIEETLEGVQRVTTIVRAMKEFSHPEETSRSLADINKALSSTLIVARNELKYVADVETDFDPDLPSIWCHLGDLNQVFLNLLVNAAHAIADTIEDSSSDRGTITVKTRRDNDNIIVSIADTGTGIPEGVRDRIFEQFFTTKGVGKGTGQGLAIARSIITEKHQGKLTFETEEGKGTTFFIQLPIVAEDTEDNPDQDTALAETTVGS